MEQITNRIGLKARMAQLEMKREAEMEAIHEEVSEFIESLKPVNLIKGFFKSVRESSDLKSDLLHGALGMATGFLTNRLLLGKMKGPFKKILGWAINAGLTNAAIRYPETIKDKGISWLTKALQSIKIGNHNGIEKQHAEGGHAL
jgi:hypothetical protein